ncbi:hypothetical protein J7K25_06775 [bacterium]|nr:hypothetical protein [bacterium]
MKIKFIGTSTCISDICSEVASFLINGKILVDTGWCNVLKMGGYGFDPLNIRYPILTYLHQDHYIELPQLLFYFGIKKSAGKYSSKVPFTIIGPSKHLKEVVNKEIEFLQIFRFPELSLDLNLVPLSPEESYRSDAFRLDTINAKHVSSRNIPEEDLVCKFTELTTKKEILAEARKVFSHLFLAKEGEEIEI